MSIPIEYRIRDSQLPFTDNEIKLLKQNITDIYKLLKTVYDRPSLLEKPYNSLTHYKIKKQRLFYRPEEFYRFTCDEIEIHILKRRGGFYSVALIGFVPDSKILKDFEKLQNMSPVEVNYSCGYSYYGFFKPSEFVNCVNLFYKLVFTVLAKRFSIDYKPIIQQMEFIF